MRIVLAIDQPSKVLRRPLASGFDAGQRIDGTAVILPTVTTREDGTTSRVGGSDPREHAQGGDAPEFDVTDDQTGRVHQRL